MILRASSQQTPTDVRCFPHWFALGPVTETIRAAFADRRAASGKTGEKGDLLLGRRICLSEVHYSGYGLAPRQFGSGIEEGLFKLEIEALRDPFELSTILLYRR
jgi:hypothetical protein